MTEPNRPQDLRSTRFVKPGASSTGSRLRVSGLPADLTDSALRRLRGMVLVYATVFFLANPFTMLLSGHFPVYLSSPAVWLPSTASIGLSLAFWAWLQWGHSPPSRALNLGMVWMVLSCYGIAFAEYWTGVPRLAAHGGSLDHIGLSWVAVFTMSFTVFVPNTARRSLLAALCSGSSVVVTVLAAQAYWGVDLGLTLGMTFFGLAFPYIIVAAMAAFCGHIIFGLGREVIKARQLGNYELVEPIGEGGMGEVWLARHRMLARPAAVKLIRLEALQGDAETADTAETRFEREAQVTASLRSPHTVELYDFGKADDGALYYVMEHLDGLDFENLVQRFGPLPAERVVFLLTQVCASLQEAHSHDLLHRDIKPANLFASRLGGSFDFVKVMDFGLVKSRTNSEVDPNLTQEGSTTGTPAYMAPETVTGDQTVDHRADLYSLGCVAYFLLTGQLVFDGKTPMKMMLQHAGEKPVPPSKRTELIVPPALEALVLACLAKDPEDRPTSALALSRALDEVALDPRWSPERATQWWSRHLP